jgi:hypothetical protein
MGVLLALPAIILAPVTSIVVGPPLLGIGIGLGCGLSKGHCASGKRDFPPPADGSVGGGGGGGGGGGVKFTVVDGTPGLPGRTDRLSAVELFPLTRPQYRQKVAPSGLGAPLPLTLKFGDDFTASHTFAHEASAYGGIPDIVYVTNHQGAPPLCLAGVEIDDDGRGHPITISGDLGAFCGADHYKSRVEVLTADTSCVWIDRHRTNGIRTAGLTFDLSAVVTAEAVAGIRSTEQLCDAPFMSPTEGWIGEAAGAGGAARGPLRRAAAGTSASGSGGGGGVDFDTLLVKSNSSASALCLDANAIGPHFVGLHERLYCNPQTHDVHPFCAGLPGICFDGAENRLVEMTEDADDQPPGRFMPRAAAGLPAGGQYNGGGHSVKVLKDFAHVDVWE